MRWNSMFDMIVRSIRLRKQLESWLEDQIKDNEVLKSLRLQPAEWKQLRYLVVLLAPLAKWTVAIGVSSGPTVHLVWAVYNELFDHLDKYSLALGSKKHQNRDAAILIDAIDAAKTKLSKYYGNTESTGKKILSLSAILDPSNKLDMYRSADWGERYLQEYRTSFHNTYMDEYATFGEMRSSSIQSGTNNNDLRSMLKSRSHINRARQSGDEALQYLESEPVGDVDPLNAWRVLEPRFPNLARMARDMLSVPGKYYFI